MRISGIVIVIVSGPWFYFLPQKERLRDLCNNSSVVIFQIKKKQEQLLKVRNFLPPQSAEPEIHLLEKLVKSAEDADKKLDSANKGEVDSGKTSPLEFEVITSNRKALVRSKNLAALALSWRICAHAQFFRDFALALTLKTF